MSTYVITYLTATHRGVHGDYETLEEAQAEFATRRDWYRERLGHVVQGTVESPEDAHDQTETFDPPESITVTPAGGTQFDVRRGEEFLDRISFGSLDADGQYEQDDDEVIEHVRERFGLDASIPVTVR